MVRKVWSKRYKNDYVCILPCIVGTKNMKQTGAPSEPIARGVSSLVSFKNGNLAAVPCFTQRYFSFGFAGPVGFGLSQGFAGVGGGVGFGFAGDDSVFPEVEDVECDSFGSSW